jgi:uncharacterized protein YqhQ
MPSSADPVAAPQPLLNYGGQAVLEGVMMRGARSIAVAVRAPDGAINLQVRPLGKFYQGWWVRVPFLRGALLLADALGLGFESLTYSAQVQLPEEKIGRGSLWLSFGLSLVVGLGLFMLLPAGIGQWFERGLALSSTWSNVAEGMVRLGLLIGYLAVIGRMPEISRVFAYHGAEHKTISAYEAGAALEPSSVARFSRYHPRCGTSFLVTLAAITVLLFALLGPMSLGMRLATRVLLLPIIVAFGYEFLRWTGRHQHLRLARWISLPGLWTQSLTTREPEEKMLEVAIAAFEAMRSAEEQPDQA